MTNRNTFIVFAREFIAEGHFSLFSDELVLAQP
ncbi:hypothetical protein PSBY109024_20085 [Pseudoalteromonas byunsanensis]